MKVAENIKLIEVVALGLACFLAVSCHKNENQAEWWRSEQERIALSQQLELKQYRFSKSRASGYGEMVELRKLVKINTDSIRDLNQRRSNLVDEVDLLEDQLAIFKQSAIPRQRDRALGRSFETLKLPSGRTFVQVKVAAINDAGVTIRHAEGSARIRFSDLNSEQQAFFGLEIDLAVAAEKKELESTVDYERVVDSQLAAMKVQGKLDSEAAKLKDQSLQAKRALGASQQIVSANVRPLAQPATSFGNRTWDSSRSDSTFRSYRPTYRYVYYSSPRDVQPCQSEYSAKYSERSMYKAGTSAHVTKCKSFAETTLPSIP